MYEVKPVTPETWGDFERLFGKRGAYGGCWCMWFRKAGKEWESARGAENKAEMCGLVDGGEVPGLLAYVDAEPAGWVSVEPREVFPRLERSRVAKRVDDAAVWSIVCFYVGKAFRGQGLMRRLLDAAVQHAAASGATMIEAYPKDLEDGLVSVDAGYVGLLPVFEAAGFVEVARRVKGRPVVRKVL